MKILSIVGARPQFIKAAVVSRAVRENNLQGGELIEEVIVHTGQHYDDNMSKIFFDELDIPRPAHHLDIHGCSHGVMTGRMIEGLERVLQEVQPDWALIFGDTNSTMAGALAAKKLNIKG
jgi:UDP-GlcNAc3NAcA epimerase